MEDYIPFVGDHVYIYSVKLDEVIEGIVEGFYEGGNRIKVLQSPQTSDDIYLRHIVSNAYVFQTYEEAVLCQEENSSSYDNSDISIGNVVHLLDSHGFPVLDAHKHYCEYQVVSVYRDRGRVSLVTSYGEHIGTYDMKDIRYCREGPIFKKEDYEKNSLVVWAEGEDVYEGRIETLHDTTAKIVEVKKLYPVNYSVRIPYWKIPEGRKSIDVSTPHVIQTIVGDDLD